MLSGRNLSIYILCSKWLFGKATRPNPHKYSLASTLYSAYKRTRFNFY